MFEKWNSKIKLFIKGWGYSIIVAVIIATSFRSAIADWNDVPTGSMKPTIIEGDRIFMNKLAYSFKIPYTLIHLLRWNEPKRGEIVVFYSPRDGKRLVKRIIGVPGDTIEMKQNQLYINDTKVVYKKCDQTKVFRTMPGFSNGYKFYIEHLESTTHHVMIVPDKNTISSFSPIVIPGDKYFVLGDNRNNSADSRFFGFVDIGQIIGRATTIVVSRDGSFLNVRWDRFLKTL